MNQLSFLRHPALLPFQFQNVHHCLPVGSVHIHEVMDSGCFGPWKAGKALMQRLEWSISGKENVLDPMSSPLVCGVVPRSS